MPNLTLIIILLVFWFKHQTSNKNIHLLLLNQIFFPCKLTFNSEQKKFQLSKKKYFHKQKVLSAELFLP